MTLRGHRVRRLSALVLCGGALLLCAGTSEGANKGKRANPAVCDAALRSALNRSAGGRLREARELFRECARPVCGATVARQCTAHALDLEADIPTIVPVVTGDMGAPLIDVAVKADGELVASRLDGRGLPLDPGLHEVTFSTPELGVFASEKVMVVAGQRNRLIAVATRKAAPPPDPAPPSPAAVAPASAPSQKAAAAPLEHVASHREESETPAPAAATAEVLSTARAPKRGRSPLPFVIGGLGLASLGAGALLTVWGNQDNAAMSSCRPNCIPNDVTYVRQMYLAADITLGAGLAALGLAGVLFFTGRSASDNRPARAAYGVDVRPAPSGAVVSVRAVF
ncbi:MAG TPA: hypothetical protein VGI39_35985 [Polyangiaceae bacterium]